MGRLRSAAVRLAPKVVVRTVDRLRLYREALIDAHHFSASTSRDGSVCIESRYADPTFQLEGQIVRAYHQIEKAFTLPMPRRPFGSRVQDRLSGFTELARRTGLEPPSHDAAAQALKALEEYNSGMDISEAIAPLCSSESSLREPWSEELASRFAHRHSVRSFDLDAHVEDSVLWRSAELAGSSPSVCNRRPWRVRFLRSRALIDSVLDLQCGAGGFAQSVPVAAIVSFERSLFSGRGERRQGFVDGGMFAMNLVWALESHGVATCFLNWSKTNSQSDALRVLCDIPDSEEIVVLVALGYPPKTYRVARSPRRPVREFCWILG